MKDILFSNSFTFRTFNYEHYKTTNNSSGIPCHYFARMIKGTARICHGGHTLVINEGDVFFLPRGCRYISHWYGEPEIRFISLKFDYLPNAENRIFPPQTIACGEDAHELFSQIVGDASSSAQNVGRFYTLAGMLIPSMHFEESGKQSKLVETAKKYIDAHPLASVGEVAQACTTSESALYLCFRKHSDVSINEYKNHVRLEAAKALIISTDTPIEEISQRLGYSSSSYFRKCFGAYFKTTPRDMRSKHSV